MICAPFIYDCEGKEGSLRINHNYPCLACHLQVDQYFTKRKTIERKLTKVELKLLSLTIFFNLSKEFIIRFTHVNFSLH